MPDLDWKEMYLQQRRELGEKLGCLAHPNNINEALRDLQRRAAGGDRKRARRQARLKRAMTEALQSEGVTAVEIKRIDDDLVRIAQKLASPWSTEC